ncbi:MAG: hypothetical protein IT372_12840 [Polyangiaceae bacterium]|nr:hypothetical protein [Polyangiaceae bacterium]
MTSSKVSKPNRGEGGPPPTDLELMLYVDGELDELRHREVEAHVLRDARCRAKIAGLDVTGAAVRDRALSSPLADGIAGAVMDRIARGDVGGAAASPHARTANGAAKPISAADLAGRAARPSGQGAGRFEKKPANDNARGIFVLAAIAAAAAAAMMIWGRMEAEPPRVASSPQAPPIESVAEPAPAPPEPVVSAGGEGEAKPGVEVAAVDFGARMGTIFYVPTGSTASSPTTTVVWLSEKGTGDE